jgi:hypothetical protein
MIFLATLSGLTHPNVGSPEVKFRESEGERNMEKQITLTVTVKQYDAIRGALHYWNHGGPWTWIDYPERKRAYDEAIDIGQTHTPFVLSDCNNDEYSAFERELEAQFNSHLVPPATPATPLLASGEETEVGSTAAASTSGC